MVTMDDAHAKLKYLLDLQKLHEPTLLTAQQSRKDGLQFCLWQAGVASASLLVLGQVRDSIDAIPDWGVKTYYVLAAVSLIAAVLTSTWSYRRYLAFSILDEQLAWMEAAKTAILVAPDGLGGGQSLEQKQVLEKYAADLNKMHERSRVFESETNKFTRRQSYLLYAGLTFMLVMVADIALYNVFWKS